MAGNASGCSGIAVRLIVNCKKRNVHPIIFNEGTERDYRYSSAFLLLMCVCVCVQGVYIQNICIYKGKGKGLSHNRPSR